MGGCAQPQEPDLKASSCCNNTDFAPWMEEISRPSKQPHVYSAPYLVRTFIKRCDLRRSASMPLQQRRRTDQHAPVASASGSRPEMVRCMCLSNWSFRRIDVCRSIAKRRQLLSWRRGTTGLRDVTSRLAWLASEAVGLLRIHGAEGRIEDKFRSVGLVEVEHVHD
jgi:hypothetical protein